MREPKKVAPLTRAQRLNGPSRRELAARADQELWNKLHKFGLTSSSSQISSGSAIVDERLRRTIGAPKGDPTVGQWHGPDHGPVRYEGTTPVVMQLRRQVWKGSQLIGLIWMDDTVPKAKENEIAEQFGGDRLAPLPLNTPLRELQRQITREHNDPNRASAT